MHEIKRLIVMTVLLAAAVGGGIWWGFNDRQEAKIRDLEARNVDLADQLEKRSEMLQRLGRERRLGLVRVLEQPEVGGWSNRRPSN